MADGWAAPLMNYQPPAATAEAQTIIDGAARRAGRDPSEIRVAPHVRDRVAIARARAPSGSDG